MNRDRFSSEAPDITSEASAWIAQLETGELRPADIDAFREWMHRSPRHVAEIKRLARLSSDLNVLTELAEPLRDAVSRYEPIMRAGRRSVFKPLMSAVFIIMMSVVIVFLSHRPKPDAEAGHPLLVATAVGEYQEVELDDGTVVKLNTDSRIEVVYGSDIRKIRLLKGEAYFDVVSDASRPFFVYAGESYVRVVGTAFLVRLFDKDVEVTVTEGRVELAKTAVLHRTDIPEGITGNQGKRAGNQDNQPKPIILEAGQSTIVTLEQSKSPIVDLSPRDIQRELSWQQGLLDFSNTPLEEVVRELSRHSLLEIEIVGPSLRELKFGGIFRTGETQPLFDALQGSYGINVEYLEDNKIRLSLTTQE